MSYRNLCCPYWNRSSKCLANSWDHAAQSDPGWVGARDKGNQVQNNGAKSFPRESKGYLGLEPENAVNCLWPNTDSLRYTPGPTRQIRWRSRTTSSQDDSGEQSGGTRVLNALAGVTWAGQQAGPATTERAARIRIAGAHYQTSSWTRVHETLRNAAGSRITENKNLDSVWKTVHLIT